MKDFAKVVPVSNDTRSVHLKTAFEANDSKVALTRSPSITIHGKKLVDNALLCLRPTNPYRIGLAKFIYHQATESIILLVIILNTIMLTLQDYSLEVYSNVLGYEWARTWQRVIEILNYSTTAIFVIEVVILFQVQGIIMGRHTYFRDAWNRMDFLIVVLALIEVGWDIFAAISDNSSDLAAKPPTKMFSAFRAFRALRPLRSFRFFEGTRAILESLRKSLGLLLNVFLFMLFFLVLFGVMGVELFGDSMSRRCAFADSNQTLMAPLIYCKSDEKCSRHFCFNGQPESFGVLGPRLNCSVDPSVIDATEELDLTPARKVFCNRDYGNPHELWNFDNFATAAYTIFQTSTLDGWAPTIMLPLMDSELSAGIVYFLGVVFFLNYLVQNLFIAVVATTFARVREAQFEEIQKLETVLKEFKTAPLTKVKNELYQKALTYRKKKKLAKERDERRRKLWTKEIVCSPTCGRICDKFKQLTDHKVFDGFITTVILLNVVTMALEFEGMPRELVMVLKLVAYRGPLGYFRVPMNAFDFLIVAAAMLNYIDAFDSSIIMLLRVFRLARISRLLRKIEQIKKLLNSVFRSLRNVINLLLFMILVLLVFAVLGMNLFGGRCCIPSCAADSNTTELETTICCAGTLAECCSGCPRWNFNTFGSSVLTLFQVLTGDSWSSVLLNNFDVGLGEAAMEPDLTSSTAFGFLTVGYFVFYYMFAQFVILNLYIAVILENFALSDEELDRRKKMISQQVRKQQGLVKRGKEIFLLRKVIKKWAVRSTTLRKKPTAIVMTESQDETCWQKFRHRTTRFVSNKWFERFILLCIILSSAMFTLEDYYLHFRPVLKKVLYYSDAVFLGIFIIEIVLRLIAFGFFSKGSGVLRSAWGWLDVVVLLATGLGLVEGTGDFVRLIRIIRIVRVLRPLRVINRLKNLRLIVNALISSMVSVVYVALLMFSLFFMFAILGVNLFRGKLNFCNDNSVSGFETCDGNAIMSVSSAAPDGSESNTIPFLMPRVWEQHWWHFDNVGAALLALFEVATLKWNGVMFSTMDITGRGVQPKLDASPGYAVFFVLFIFISLFCWNLFIAVIIDHFNQESGSAFLTEAQKNWVEMKRLFMIIKPKKQMKLPASKCRAIFYRISRSKVFQYFMLVVVMTNVGFMASNFYVPEDERGPGSWYFALEMINHGFLFLYIIELTINLVGLGFGYFFHKGWYLFDFIIVTGSLIFGILESLTGAKAFVLVSRSLRFLRIFRLVKYIKGLKILFQTLIISAPSIFNVIGLLLIMYAVFACIAMQLFGKVRYQVFFNRNANFRTFPMSVATLWQLASGDEWMGVMRDAMHSESFLPCTRVTDYPYLIGLGHNPGESDCGDAVIAPIFFVLFYILSVFVFLNLLVAVIMESFESVYTKEVSKLNESHLLLFRDAWALEDPQAKGYMASKNFIRFILKLDPPLGFNSLDTTGEQKSLVKLEDEAHQLEYVVRLKSFARSSEKKLRRKKTLDVVGKLGDRYYMRDVLEMLVIRALGEDNLTDEDKEKMRKLLTAITGFKAKRVSPDVLSMHNVSDDEQEVGGERDTPKLSQTMNRSTKVHPETNDVRMGASLQ